MTNSARVMPRAKASEIGKSFRQIKTIFIYSTTFCPKHFITSLIKSRVACAKSRSDTFCGNLTKLLQKVETVSWITSGISSLTSTSISLFNSFLYVNYSFVKLKNKPLFYKHLQTFIKLVMASWLTCDSASINWQFDLTEDQWE